ncbi:uncharacterized protein LOC123312054 [Coccinella septempunctata]|uniref:uncharacterized protein LOC123312054 n=1 Tax=Coccinella septempunctata TaxID=41139 RepID=UPI001D06AC51|nr:uncharacterized protein LOC123312054 [Coccinella septempunctata]
MKKYDKYVNNNEENKKTAGIKEILNNSMPQRDYVRRYSIKEKYDLQDNYEWNSRGNTNFKSSHQLIVPKNELYLSQTCNKNCKATKIYSKRKRKNNNKQISIDEYLSATKNIQCDKISSQYLTNSPSTHKSDSNTPNGADHGVSSSVNIKSEENSHFNINVALQLSSQISYSHSIDTIPKRKISEYFPLKKYIHKKRLPEKPSKWISLNLLEEKATDKKSNESLNSSANISSRPEKFSHHEYSSSDRIDWVSRGLRRDKIDCELSIPKSELFVKNNCSSTEQNSTYKNKRKKRKYYPDNKKKIRQTTLYDSFMKKYDNLMNENKDSKLDKASKNKHFDTNEKSTTTGSPLKTYNKEQISCVKHDENSSRNTIKSKDISPPCGSSEKYDNDLNGKSISINTIGFQSLIYEKDMPESNTIIGFVKPNELKDDQLHASPTDLSETSIVGEQQIMNIKKNYECSQQESQEIDNIIPELSSQKEIRNSLLYKEYVSSSSHLGNDCSNKPSSNSGNIKDMAKCNLHSSFEYNTIEKNIRDTVLSDSKLKESEEVPQIIRGTEKLVDKNDTDNRKNLVSQIPKIKLQEPFIVSSYHLLKSVSSPVIKDLECREYLRDLVSSNQLEKSSSLPEDIPNSYHAAHQECSQENFLHFWENILSQNQEDCSQNVSNSPAIGASSHNIPRRAQPNAQDGSEVFQYILSQDCVNSDALVNNAIKNMNNLSQKVTEKRNLIFDSNKNANKLLEIAFKIYSQHKEKSILSKAQSSVCQRFSKLSVTKKIEGHVCIYRIIKNGDGKNEFSRNETVRLWNDPVSKSSISESDGNILSGLKEICENISYLHDESNDGLLISVKTENDIENRIMSIFERVLNDLNEKKSPCLEIRRQTFEDCVLVHDRLELKSEENPKMIRVKYKSTSSQFKFCLMMYVLAKVLQVLETNSKTTRRELYYQIKHLVLNQSYIDRAVKAVCYMLCVGPWELNIVAHKGLIFGDLKIVMSSNEIVDCNIPGTLIPQDIDEIVELRSSAYFILVVEKESIFYKLLEEDLPNKLVRPFLMITGKGFPDLNTQLFLKKLWIIMTIPVFIFTDADPHGVNIMMTYRFGSLANVHLSKQLAVPKAQWLGVFPSEIVKLNADKQSLTETERTLVRNLLKSPYMKINSKIEKELKIMLESGYKAGIEGIIKNNTFLSEFYFPLKFHNKDLI